MDDVEKLLFDEIPVMESPEPKRCEWCKQPLPAHAGGDHHGGRPYRLAICPQCRKESIAAFLKVN